MQYDLLDLRLFLLVVTEGSITRGAERLPLSLPSASARLRALERHSGVELLVRGRRGIRPTPAGLAFARHAREVIEALDRLQDGLASYAGPVGEPLTLVAGSSAMSSLVPRALQSFLPVHADRDVITSERRSVDSVRLLADGAADLGIVVDHSRDVAGGDDDLGDDSLVVVGPADGVLADRRSVSFAEAAEHPMVGLDAGAALMQTLEANLPPGAPIPRYRARTNQLRALVDLAAIGVGLAVLPRHVVDPSQPVAICELTEPWARRRLVLRLGAHPGPGTDDLAEHLRRAVRR